MKSNLAVAFLISVLAILGVVFVEDVTAGSLESGQAVVGEADGSLSTDSETLELEAAATPPARVEKTGQTIKYGSRDDGALKRGVAWPNPRFTDNGDGTVTDNLTGLIWLKNASCDTFYAEDSNGQSSRNWKGALGAANRLASGYCGLTDGSQAGQWRLPNRRELESLLHLGFHNPALPNTAGTGQGSEGDPFLGVKSFYYWSSTTFAATTGDAWVIALDKGYAVTFSKPIAHYVWPVRGGQ